MQKRTILLTVTLAMLAVIVALPGSATGNPPDPDRLGETLGQDEGQFYPTQAPTHEDAYLFLKKKCLKNANMAAFDRAKLALVEARDCMLTQLDDTEMEEEMDDMSPINPLDFAVMQYCRKSLVLQECVSNFTSVLEPCADEDERARISSILNITETMAQFLCFREGARISLFITKGGVECAMANQNGIKDCINATVGQHNPGAVPSGSKPPAEIYDAKGCKDFWTVKKCIVRNMETCPDPTPAILVDSLLTHTYKMTPCSRLPIESTPTIRPALH